MRNKVGATRLPAGVLRCRHAELALPTLTTCTSSQVAVHLPGTDAMAAGSDCSCKPPAVRA
jgi:hypothetical protein